MPIAVKDNTQLCPPSPPWEQCPFALPMEGPLCSWSLGTPLKPLGLASIQ